jgi:hypothetical protein
MTPLPLTLCLYTSTKGHFSRDTYRETVTDFLRQVPASYLDMLLVHIKSEPGHEGKLGEMGEWLKDHGFIVFDTCQTWKHDDPSHNHGYCMDIKKMASKIHSPYYLGLEDDWVMSSESVVNQLAEAIKKLETDPNLMQVRFPRFTNEYERIINLRSKHGIDSRAEVGILGGVFHNDWSNHPHVVRTRDINAAIRFVFATNLPKHSEHGLGVAMKMLSDSDKPFFTPDSNQIRVGHIGVPTNAERDDLTKPLIAT